MPDYTFPKKERLLKKWEFQRVLNQNKKFIGKYLILYVLENQSERKVGVIASKKLGKAVKRNRAKRLIREAYRLNKYLLPGNIHIVVIAKPEIIGLKYKDVSEDFIEILSKANIICKG